MKLLIPETEVKLILDNKRALIGKMLSYELVSMFGVESDAQVMMVWYIDTPAQALRKAGWSVRFRLKPESGLELTYKKRYTEPGYRAMLQTETAQKFAKDFQPEIDLGYSKKTCSLSHIRKFGQEFGGLDMLEARRLAILNCPDILRDWCGKNRGFAHLCEAVLLGPVSADTYKGSFEGIQIKFEIWPLRARLAELSFDIKSERADLMKKKVSAVLDAHHFIRKTDRLKTDALFDDYARRLKKRG